VSPYLKNTQQQQKRAGGVAQALESLPSKHEALSSNPSTIKPQYYDVASKCHCGDRLKTSLDIPAGALILVFFSFQTMGK
jgi:hypothetical protein